MQDISYVQIIAFIGMCVWLIFPIGMFISIIRQDRESLRSPDDVSLSNEDNLPKIFSHKKMLYEDELEEALPLDDIEEPVFEDDFNHPHRGIGSSHPHHLV